MPDELALYLLIGQIYDAAIGNEDWTVLVQHLMLAVGGASAILRWRGRPAGSAITINMDPATHNAYDAQYHGIDPIWPLLRRLPPGSAVADRALMAKQTLERTEFYQDFMVPNGMETGLSWYGLDMAGQPVALYLMPRPGQPFQGGEALRLLRSLAPHLSRAIAIEDRLVATEARRKAVQLSRQNPDLSPRERDCLARVARGASSKGIARQLALSVDTVNEYIGAAMRKLQASSRSEAVAIAVVLGLLLP